MLPACVERCHVAVSFPMPKLVRVKQPAVQARVNLEHQNKDVQVQIIQHLEHVCLAIQMRALDKKANKIEKLKNKKGGHAAWEDVHELGQLIRCGQVCDLLQSLTMLLHCMLGLHHLCFHVPSKWQTGLQA